MSLCNQQLKECFYDYPMKARQWRDHYRSMCDGDDEWLSMDFAMEIDTVMITALQSAFMQGIISGHEYSRIGGKVWEIWAEFDNEIKQPKEETLWNRVKKRIRSMLKLG